MSEQNTNEATGKCKTTDYVDDRIIVKFKEPQLFDKPGLFKLKTAPDIKGVSVESSRVINPAPAGRFTADSIANQNRQGKLVLVELTESGPEAVKRAIEQFEKREDVEYAEKCYKVRISGANDEQPTTPERCCLYGLDKINAPRAWETARGDNIVVGVIDTGVDIRHPSIRNSLWNNPDPGALGYEDDEHGYDFIHRVGYKVGAGASDDASGHGTHIAGTIAANPFGACSIMGVAPNAKICVIKVIHDLEGDVSTIIEGINYANNLGIPITNNSYFAITGQSRALRETIENGGLYVACAGNDHADIDKNPTLPASFDCDNIIAVAATDHNDKLCEFSNYGVESVHLTAPGYNICSLLAHTEMSFIPPTPDYEFRYITMSGTSMATPHVAGAAALVLSELITARGYSSDMIDRETIKTLIMDVKKKLVDNTDPIPGLKGKVITGGRLNAYAAVKSE